MDSYSLNRNNIVLEEVRVKSSYEMAYFYLSQEPSIRRDAISTVLDSMQCVLPRHLIVLHHIHHDEGW